MLTDNEILRIVKAEQADSVGYADEIGEKREKLMDYYHGRPFGDEVDGRSRFVSSDVADIVEGMLPDLMEVFTQSRQVFSFPSNTMAGDAEAREKEVLSNWVFFEQNQGVLNLQNKFKDALLQYTGVIKVFWDEETTTKEEILEDLTIDDYNDLVGGDGVKIKKEEKLTTNIDGIEIPTYNVTIERQETKGKVCYENIPPEEFLISREARDFIKPKMIGHRTLKSRSDLIDMGFDRGLVSMLPDYQRATDGDGQKAARYYDYSDNEYTNASSHHPNDLVELSEIYMHIDVDEDGVSELWQVFTSGNKLLEKSRFEEHPFACGTPIPLPHRAIGTCPAEQVADIQYLKSVLVRHAQDNIYTSNYNRFLVNERVNMDDMLSPVPGGSVAVDGDAPVQGSVELLPSTPQVPQILQQIEYIDASSERRTGFTRFSQGLDADALNHTATGFKGITQAGRNRVKLIARVFAETSVKELGRKTVNLLSKYQDPVTIKSEGQEITINPKSWTQDMNCVVQVGMGSGDKAEKIASLNALLERQVQAIQLGSTLTDESKVYNTLKQLTYEIGLQDPQSYWNDPTQPIEVLMAQNAQLTQQVQELSQMVEDNPFTESEKIKAQADLIEAQSKESIELAKLDQDMRKFVLQLDQKDQEAYQDLVAKLTEMELKYNADVPGSAV